MMGAYTSDSIWEKALREATAFAFGSFIYRLQVYGYWAY